MITIEEFDRVQQILGRKGKPRPKKYEFAFTGFIRCGGCGSAITASLKTKLIKSTGSYKTYVFYHCTKRKGDCPDKHYTKAEDLEAMIEQELSNFHLQKEFKDWAIEILEENHQNEFNKQSELMQENAVAEQKILRELDILIDMRISSQITEEKYIQKKAEKDAQLIRVQEKKNQLNTGAINWLDKLKQQLDFAALAVNRFKSKDTQQQKSVCLNFGWNWTLKANKLLIDKFEWFEPIQIYKKAVEDKFDPLEPKKTFVEYGKNAALDILRPIVCRLRDDVSTATSTEYGVRGEQMAPPETSSPLLDAV